jgi:hypothetical protein
MDVQVAINEQSITYNQMPPTLEDVYTCEFCFRYVHLWYIEDVQEVERISQ